METPKDTNGEIHDKGSSKKYWTTDEDEILLQLVHQHGARRWGSIACHLEGRTEHSCRLRWLNHLNPMVNRNPLDENEEEKLFRLQRIYGNKWAVMTRYFPGRTDNQLKNRFHNLKLKRLNQQISESSQNQHYTTTVSHGSTSTLRHSRGKIDLNYPPHSNLSHLRSGLGESCIPPMLRSSDQSGSRVQYPMSYEFIAPKLSSLSKVGVDLAERIIHGGQSDTQGSSNGLSMVSDLAPLPELNSVTCEEPMDEQMKHKNDVFFDFLGVNE